MEMEMKQDSNKPPGFIEYPRDQFTDCDDDNKMNNIKQHSQVVFGVEMNEAGQETKIPGEQTLISHDSDCETPKKGRDISSMDKHIVAGADIAKQLQLYIESSSQKISALEGHCTVNSNQLQNINRKLDKLMGLMVSNNNVQLDQIMLGFNDRNNFIGPHHIVSEDGSHYDEVKQCVMSDKDGDETRTVNIPPPRRNNYGYDQYEYQSHEYQVSAFRLDTNSDKKKWRKRGKSCPIL